MCIQQHSDYERKEVFLVVLDQKINKLITKGSVAEAYSVENREYRLRNLITPAIGLYPKCAGYTILKSRELFDTMYGDFEIYPRGFSAKYLKSAFIDTYGEETPFVSLGKKFACIKTTNFARDLAAKIVGLSSNERLITITLRKSKYDPKRNSNVYEWAKFANYAAEKGYRVVVMPDTENPSEFEPIRKELVYTQFVYNVELRAALYEISDCNLGVANGPLGLSHFNENVKSTIMLKIAPPGSENAEQYKSSGVNPDEPYYWFNKSTFNSSLNDTYENIKKLFDTAIGI